jgi:hypothetical protein
MQSRNESHHATSSNVNEWLEHRVVDAPVVMPFCFLRLRRLALPRGNAEIGKHAVCVLDECWNFTTAACKRPPGADVRRLQPRPRRSCGSRRVDHTLHRRERTPLIPRRSCVVTRVGVTCLGPGRVGQGPSHRVASYHVCRLCLASERWLCSSTAADEQKGRANKRILRKALAHSAHVERHNDAPCEDRGQCDDRTPESSATEAPCHDANRHQSATCWVTAVRASSITVPS